MTFRTLLLAGTAAALFALPAAAKPNGWFVGLSGGVSTIEKSNIFSVPGSTFPYGGAVDEQADMDMGWIAAGTVGYRWASNWRLEAELSFRHNEGDLVVPPASDRGDLEITELTGMVNALYDFPISSKWTLSVGAGLGGDLVSYDDTNLAGGFGYTGVPPAGGLSYDDDFVLAGQLIAQLGVMVTSRLELYADYRYLVADTPVFESTTTTDAIEMEIDKHAAMIGLRYDLHADYVPPPPPPPVVAAPPPPPMKEFVVFFGFNKYNLTADAQSVVAEAAAQAKSQGSASIRVVGHTDTSGSSRYNQVLSEKRAKAVSEELVRQGIAAGAISASGRGENELLVQTGDGVKEPQNRRATIKLQ